MSSKFSLQKPYVVATLPRPIDHQNGRYVVGEVYGGLPGSKKRKRAEAAVGIDGEGVNIYDIASSRLITSYALPPQSRFTCPPTSTRTKASKTKTERRTYVSTVETQAQISAFCESNDESTASTSTTATRNVENSIKPIVFLGTVTATRGTNISENSFDLIAVTETGEVKCYDGETLADRWTSPAFVLARDNSPTTEPVKVEFAQLTNSYSASQGILRGRQDVFAVFPEEIAEDAFNPELLVLITRTSEIRTLHILAMPRRSGGQIFANQSVESLLTVDLPKETFSIEKPSFSLQVSTGVLQQLSKDSLYSIDLTDTIPKITSTLTTTGARSFLRLSNTSVMVLEDSAITVFNPKYRSILSTVALDSSDSLKRKRDDDSSNLTLNPKCEFVSYFPKLGSAVAIFGNDLIAVQVEGQMDRLGRPRATGLLIDSLGCSMKGQSRLIRPKRGKSDADFDLQTMDLSTFGSLGNTQAPFDDQVKSLETAVSKGSVDSFDALFSNKTGVQFSFDRTANGSRIEGESVKSAVAKDVTQLLPTVDRRWIIYALSKIFTMPGDVDASKLSISFYPPQTFTWLISNGHMTAVNVEMALRNNATGVLQPGHLVDALVELDMDLDLLLLLVMNNHLGAAELLQAIRRLMESLGLIGNATKQALLTNGDESLEDVDAEEQIRRLEAEAENDLAMAEYQLGSGSGVRGHALSTALSKLYACPDATIIYGIQTSFNATETIALIYLLRYELARGAWTSRYLDSDEANIIDEDAEIPNHSIILIASLLNNCIDAIGAGGWLTGESRLVSGDPYEAEELIASLKLEVGAALEGIEEAKYLGGLISEMVRYGDLVQKRDCGQEEEAPGPNRTRKARAITVKSEQEKMLPLGLKVENLISAEKVGAGGEIQRRSGRELAHLNRKKVGKYTMERINV